MHSMTRSRCTALVIALLLPVFANAKLPAWSDRAAHREGFVQTNGVRLEYLDWGGTGPALIFIHGLGDNPHIFDDLAPAFTDHFRVIAYARRGHGLSQVKGPYDTATLTEDLRGLMDALKIAKADLVGWSMGGNEITAMATEYPQRVRRIVYFDALYDYADPDWAAAIKAIPASLLSEPPPSALSSFDAYRSYEKAVEFPSLHDMRRIEAYLREQVVVQSDGSVKLRMPKELEAALFASLSTNPRREYARVRAPVLAFYAEFGMDPRVADSERRRDGVEWERKYLQPLRAKSISRARRELANVQIVGVPGSHSGFFLTSREQVVAAMRRFFSAPMPGA